MKFGVWILGCWILDFFVWKRGQGVYIVFPDGFLLFFRGKPFQTPLRYTCFGCFVGLDFGFVQCEIWSLDLGLLDFCFFCLEKGPGGLHCFH